MMKLGFLSPRSKVHPAIGPDLIAGLKLFLKNCGKENDVEIISESAGFGGLEKEVHEKAEQLLMMDEVDVLVAFIDEKVMPVLKPLFLASQKLIIIINAGANYPLNWVPQENIIYLTLQHSFCNWLAGGAAALKGAEAATVTTFYDSGYLHAAASVKNYVKKNGNIRFNYVNNDKYDHSFSIQPLTDFLKENTSVNELLCTFDTLPASLFYTALSKDLPQNGLRLFVSPMMLQQSSGEHDDNRFPFTITGYNSLTTGTDSEAYKTFAALCEANKKNISAFSILGWETGMLIDFIAENKAGDGAAQAELLKTTSFESPRGTLKLDEETNFFITPIYKYYMNAGEKVFTVTEADNAAEEWKNFTDEPTIGVISGWTNTYLCY